MKTLCPAEGSEEFVCWPVTGIFGGQGIISDGLMICSEPVKEKAWLMEDTQERFPV